LLNLARLKISEKQVERVTERIGQERFEQRDAQVQAFLELPVMEKFAVAVAHPPNLAVVEMDGGRLQIRKEPRSDPATAGVASPVEEVSLAVEATPGQTVAGPAAAEATPGQAVAKPAAAEATPGQAVAEPAAAVEATSVAGPAAAEATPGQTVAGPAAAETRNH